MANLKSYEDLGGDATGTAIGEVLFADYAEAGQSPNPGMGVWFFRTAYDAMFMPVEVSVAKHRAEWREALGLSPAFVEAPIAPVDYAGNLCGIRIPGLPPVPGGAPDSSLVLSWFYDRYSAVDRGRIRSAWLAKGYLDVCLSWPDSRAHGAGPTQFAATCEELVQAGLRPLVMLLSKVYDPHQNWQGCLANVEPVLPLLLSPRVVSRISIGWELSIPDGEPTGWLSPSDVQHLTDAIAPRCVAAGVKTYVHFQPGFSHYSATDPGGTFASYWNLQVGKLEGILHQKVPNWTDEEYQSRLGDILDRFAGGFLTVPDNGFGRPFSCIGWEITASQQFAGSLTEAQGNRMGQVAITTPARQGPFGSVRVMGSGNGQ